MKTDRQNMVVRIVTLTSDEATMLMRSDVVAQFGLPSGLHGKH
jgi:hypothetical protein